jgi:hypothetical protein
VTTDTERTRLLANELAEPPPATINRWIEAKVRLVTRSGRHLVVGAVLVLTACSSGGSSRGTRATDSGRIVPTSASIGTQARGSTTTTTEPPYSFDGSIPPPRLVNTGTDYDAMVRSLAEYAAWLEAHHPDLCLISEVAAPEPVA